MTTILQLSCPECEQIVDMEMTLEDEEQEFHKFMTQLTNTKHYTFKGGMRCGCGKFVIGCLSVTANTRS